MSDKPCPDATCGLRAHTGPCWCAWGGNPDGPLPETDRLAEQNDGLYEAVKILAAERDDLNEFVKAHGLVGALQTWRKRGSEGTQE